MSEYEMASIYTQIAENLGTQLTNYLTMLSVYVGAGYLLAHRINLRSAIALSIIFGIVNLGTITVIVNAARSWMGIARKIREAAEHGYGLRWHNASDIPDWVLTFFPINTALLLTVVAIGAIYLFFAARSQSVKTPAGGSSDEQVTVAGA